MTENELGDFDCSWARESANSAIDRAISASLGEGNTARVSINCLKGNCKKKFTAEAESGLVTKCNFSKSENCMVYNTTSPGESS